MSTISRLFWLGTRIRLAPASRANSSRSGRFVSWATPPEVKEADERHSVFNEKNVTECYLHDNKGLLKLAIREGPDDCKGIRERSSCSTVSGVPARPVSLRRCRRFSTGPCS